MFGDLMGNMEEQQAQLREKLAGITVEAEVQDGAVKVVATANRQIRQISISPDLMDPEDSEQLEDLLVVAVNRALELAAEKEAEEAQKMVKDMLPPGLDDLSGLFG